MGLIVVIGWIRSVCGVEIGFGFVASSFSVVLERAYELLERALYIVEVNKLNQKWTVGSGRLCSNEHIE